MIQKISIAYNSDNEVSQNLQSLIEYIGVQYKISIDLFDYRKEIDEISKSVLILLYLDDIKIKTFLKNNLNSSIKIGIIPNKECPRVLNSYGISKDVYVAIDEAMNQTNLSLVDVLTCNGEVVFTNMVIGDVYGINHKNIDSQSIFEKIRSFYINLKHLKFKDYTLTTAKGQSVQTAATGVMVLEYNSKFEKYSIINDDLSLHDGKLNAFIISPASILSYIYYILVVTFYAKLNPNSLPKTIGFIKTSKLDIASTKAIDFTVDGVFMSSKEVNLEVFKDSITISLGKNIVQNAQNNTKPEDDKEVIKTQHLAKGEFRNLLLTESVPLFKKANEEDFKELFLSLKENAKPSFIFIVLMVLSTLLATTGLFQSSAPVIIGAMILAPLMSPIISLSMGVVRGESFLINDSLKTLGFGIITALIFSSLYTYFMPLNVLTDEMRGRLNPNVLDLMVAIISGIAGAYANAKSEIAKSLAGVAIAVALVPPLSVTGIGFGWGSFDIAYSSFLLFLTNLVGITLSASITFVVLGYSPIRRAKKGIIYTFTILSIVTIPLVASFEKAITQNNITAKLNNKIFVENKKKITLHILNVDLSKKKPEIFLQTNSNDVLDKTDLNLLKNDIEKKLKQSVVLNISTNTIVQ